MAQPTLGIPLVDYGTSVDKDAAVLFLKTRDDALQSGDRSATCSVVRDGFMRCSISALELGSLWRCDDKLIIATADWIRPGCVRAQLKVV